MTAATATAAPRRSRKLLVPLATLVAATGIAYASGANFTSATASTGLVASGTLTQTNSNSVAFSRTNLKPGDVVTGSVTITNDGTLPAWFSISEAEGANTFTNQALLNLKISDGTAVVYDGELGAAGSKPVAAPFAAGEARTFGFAVTLSSAAGNVEQGKSAATTYTFNAVQSAPSTFEGTQSGVVTESTGADIGGLTIPSTVQLDQPEN